MSTDKDNNEKTFIIEGKKRFIVKLEDNTGKEPETEEIIPKKRNFHHNIPSKINCSIYRYIHRFRGRHNLFYNTRRRQRGLCPRRRGGVKLIIKNLTKEVTNYDIKSIFEKIGPISRCGIIWNNIYGNKNVAEIEYVYSSDAFKAYRKLDYKSIKGIPIRIIIKDMSKPIFFGRKIPYVDYSKFYSRNYLRRIEKRNARRRSHYYGNGAMNFWKSRKMFHK